MSSFNLYKRWGASLRSLFLVSVLALVGLVSANAQAEIRVLAAGGDSLGPYGTEQIFANGDVVGYIDRPAWSDYRLLTTEDIVNNYDVLIIPRNTADWQYDFDWNTRVLPFLASGGGVIWEAPMTTGYANAPIFTMQGVRYACGTVVCNVPASPLDVLSVPGLSDGIGSDFTFTTGYFPTWDSALSPLLQVDATGLGTITVGLYGEINAGRIVITSSAQDDVANPAGTAAEVNAYNLLINKIQWAASSTATPDPDLRFMPNLMGLSEADAIAALTSRDYVVSNTFYTTTNLEAYGNVSSQDPQPGTAGFAGDSINMFVVDTPTTPEVTVPDVKGMLTADAEITLNAVNLDRGGLTWGYHPTVPAGAIVAQNKAAGQISNETWTVDLVESNGAGVDRVPVLKWSTQADAEAALTASGYVVGAIAAQNHNVIPAGNVIDQDPYAGATRAAGTVVSMVVSSGVAGAAPIIVADVVGQSQAAAEAALSAQGLNVSVTTTNSETVAAGNVISQDPTGGAEVAAASTVNLVVSAGPAPVIVTVPDVTGASQAAAEAAIAAAGLAVGNVTNAYSDTVAAGDVVSQNPAGGSNVGEGSTVDLVVSNGPAPVVITVPGVEGLSQAAAESAIMAASLTVGTVTTANSSTVAAGNVISQTPAAGSSVGEGTAVDLVVSTGPVMVDVPSVTGSSQSAAESAITAAGLSVGNVTTTSSDTVAAGDVVSQTPAGGSSAEEGTSVDLVVSTGPALVAVPSVTGLSQGTAEAAITSAGLVVGNVTTASSSTVAEGDVISQTPAGGSDVELGTSVDLVISTGSDLVTVPGVVGGSYSNAINAIENAGLVVGNVTTVTTRRSCGRVRSQSPAGGTDVPAGTEIDLVVSRTRFCNPL